MKFWHITDNDDREYLVVADSWNKLVEKLSNMSQKPIEINTKTHEYLIDGEVKGNFRRINEQDLADIIWDGVEINPYLSPTP